MQPLLSVRARWTQYGDISLISNSTIVRNRFAKNWLICLNKPVLTISLTICSPNHCDCCDPSRVEQLFSLLSGGVASLNPRLMARNPSGCKGLRTFVYHDERVVLVPKNDKESETNVMKTISLEIDERIYPQVLNFLRLLPEEQCHILEDEDSLSAEELAAVQTIQSRLRAGDESEFVDWDEIKERL